MGSESGLVGEHTNNFLYWLSNKIWIIYDEYKMKLSFLSTHDKRNLQKNGKGHIYLTAHIQPLVTASVV